LPSRTIAAGGNLNTSADLTGATILIVDDESLIALI
jgi:hypothetical protein